MVLVVDQIAKGHNSRFAFRQNTDQWGRKAAVCGAGHGIQVDNQTMLPASTLIDNDAATGSIGRHKGRKGNEIVAGEIGPMPWMYRGLEAMLAQVFGTSPTPTNLAGTAYKHEMRLANNHRGIYGTFLADYFQDGDGPIWEYPFVKLTGFRLEWEQGGMAKCTFMGQGFQILYNIGTQNPVTVVSSVEPANGARTIAAQPGKASKLHVRITDANVSITEYILTFVGKGDQGQALTEVYTLSTDTLLWTSDNLFREITSITGSGLAGTATGDTLEIFTAPVVRRATPANGALTIDAQPPNPTQLLITITDANSGITEFIVTIVGTDPDDRPVTAIYVLSRDGGPGSHTFVTKEIFKTVTSATGSAIAGTATAGTDFIQIDCQNGVNNRTTVASVTEPSDREFAVWADIEAVLINNESAGALTPESEESGGVVVPNDEIYPSTLSIELNLTPTEGDVTTRFRNKVDEPVTAGAGFAELTISIGLSKYSRPDQELLKSQLSKGTKKMKIQARGSQIASTGYFFGFDWWFPCIQFSEGAPAQSGAGVLPFDITAMAKTADAVPTGFPTGVDEMVALDVYSTLSSAALA